MFAFAFIILVVILLMLAQFKGDFNRRIHELQEKIEQLEGRTTGEPPVPIATPETTSVTTPSSLFTYLKTVFRENWPVKIAACLLVIGFAFLVKLDMEAPYGNNKTLPVSLRGPLLGALLLVAAHVLRKRWRIISSVLVGIGAMILYVTIMVSFLMDESICQYMANFLTLGIAVFLLILSYNYNRKEIAIIAVTLGSFFMLFAGKGAGLLPLGYMFLLHAGTLALAQYKRWHIVSISAFIVMIVLFSLMITCSDAWVGVLPMPGNLDAIPEADQTILTILLFSSLFYLLYLADHVIAHIRGWIPFNWFAITLILLNALFYYVNGCAIIHTMNDGMFLGCFTVLLALIHFLVAWRLYRDPRADKQLVFLLIGMVLAFATLAGPAQFLNGYTIIFWAVECLLLFWLHQQTGLRVIKYAAVLVVIVMLLGLAACWIQTYAFNYDITCFVAGIIAIAALLLFRYLLDKESAGKWDIGAGIVVFFLGAAAIIVIYGVLQLELHYQIKYHWTLMMPITDGIFTYLFLAVLLVILRPVGTPVTTILLVITAIALLCYPLLLNNAVIVVRNRYLLRGTHFNYVLMHYPLLILYFVLLYLCYKLIPPKYIPVFQWVCVIAVIYALSASMDHLAALTGFNHKAPIRLIVHHNQGLGYMLLWTFASVVIMYLGITWGAKQLRIIALSLFGLMLLKLFFIDLPEMPLTGKICAFVFLGLLLTGIILLYQWLKKILFE